ncbi:MAG: hypothetical protein WCE81_06025 [Halobacteriota archaeon]
MKFEFSQPALKYMLEDKDVVAAFEEAATTIHKIITEPNYELFKRLRGDSNDN